MRESKARAFMFTCIGILAICIAVQVTIPATAQSPDPTSIAAAFRTIYSCDAILMDNGDLYTNQLMGPIGWSFNSNVFESPIDNTDSSLGDVKKSFR